MGSVRLARRMGSHPDEWSLAIKLVHPHLARDTEYAERFRDEARLAMRVNHPYVCRVFEYGESDDGIPYIVMERLMGQPLSRVLEELRQSPLGPDDMAEHCAFVARIITWLCEALHVVHEMQNDGGQPMNIVHRDISPQNIFVVDDGSVRLLDFGIAQGKHRLAMTRTGNLRGKAPYMAPEYLMSEHFDRRIDVWSLGVVLWELLTFETLYGGRPELQTLQMIVSQSAPTPSSVREGVPAALDLITMRALDRDPAARFQTAQALGQALERWLDESLEPVSTREISSCLRKLFPPAAPAITISDNGTGEMVVGTVDIVGFVPRPSFAATKAYPGDWTPPRTMAGIGMAPPLQLGGSPLPMGRADMLLPLATDLHTGPQINIIADDAGGNPPQAIEPQVADVPSVADEPLPPPASTFKTIDVTLKSKRPTARELAKLTASGRKSVWAMRLTRLEQLVSGRAFQLSIAALTVLGAYFAGARVGTQQVTEGVSQPRPSAEVSAHETSAVDGTTARAVPVVVPPARSGSVAAPTVAVPTPSHAVVPPAVVAPAVPQPRSADKPAESSNERAPTPVAAKARETRIPAAEGPAGVPTKQAPSESRRGEAARPAATPRPAAAVDAVPMGDIVITCTSGPGTVWKDSKLLGKTPLRTRLPEGTHSLTVKTDAGATYVVAAKVTARRIVLVNAGP